MIGGIIGHSMAIDERSAGHVLMQARQGAQALERAKRGTTARAPCTHNQASAQPATAMTTAEPHAHKPLTPRHTTHSCTVVPCKIVLPLRWRPMG